MTLTQRLDEYVRACFSGIWIESHEHQDAIREIAELCSQEGWKLATWDIDRGLRCRGETTDAPDPLAAVGLARWGIPHAEAGIRLTLAESTELDDAACILRWLRERDSLEVSQREVLAHGRARCSAWAAIGQTTTCEHNSAGSLSGRGWFRGRKCSSTCDPPGGLSYKNNSPIIRLIGGWAILGPWRPSIICKSPMSTGGGRRPPVYPL